MLLRSITKHVKDQNWFAVFIDFLIVVLGILIAFQITEWNNTQQELREEQALKVRLTEEFKVLEERLTVRLDRAATITDHSSELIEMIRTETEPKDEDLIKIMLRSAIRYNAPIPPPSIFTEAIQAGRIGKLRNDELRKALNEYQVSANWWTSVDGPFVAQHDPNSKLNQSLSISNDRQNWQKLKGTVISYDWDLVKLAEKELSLIQRWQNFQEETYILELASVKNVLAELESD